MGDPPTETPTPHPLEQRAKHELMVYRCKRYAAYDTSLYQAVKGLTDTTSSEERHKIMNEFQAYRTLLRVTATPDGKDKNEHISDAVQLLQSILSNNEAYHREPDTVMTYDQKIKLLGETETYFAKKYPSTDTPSTILQIPNNFELPSEVQKYHDELFHYDHDIMNFFNSMLMADGLLHEADDHMLRDLFEKSREQFLTLAEKYNEFHETSIESFCNTMAKRWKGIAIPSDLVTTLNNLNIMASESFILKMTSNVRQNADRAFRAQQLVGIDNETPRTSLQSIGNNDRVHNIDALSQHAFIGVDNPDNPTYLNVTFTDNGPGFPQTLLDKGRFEQGLTEYQGGVQGTGIGMAGLQKEFALTGGTIEFTNTDIFSKLSPEQKTKFGLPPEFSQDHGAIITFRFPILHLQKPEFEPQAVPTE